jgi:hypothetical protein
VISRPRISPDRPAIEYGCACRGIGVEKRSPLHEHPNKTVSTADKGWWILLVVEGMIQRYLPVILD